MTVKDRCFRLLLCCLAALLGAGAAAQAMADQPRGNRIEYLSEREAAGRRDSDDRLFIIAGPLVGQRL